jgi:hypothetical protein
MRTFKYIQDPVFLASAGIYGLNRLLLRLHTPAPSFIRFHLNDLLLVPVALPIVLFGLRILKVRPVHLPPTLSEVLVAAAIWSMSFEVIGPAVFHRGTSDELDVLAYVVGGLISWSIWNRPSRGRVPDTPPGAPF